MPDKNKIILGTNDDTYIAADDAGNIVLQHEQGQRVALTDSAIEPATDETLDLGSATNKFKDLYLSSDSIYIGNTKLSSDPTTGALSTVVADEQGQYTAPASPVGGGAGSAFDWEGEGYTYIHAPLQGRTDYAAEILKTAGALNYWDPIETWQYMDSAGYFGDHYTTQRPNGGTNYSNYYIISPLGQENWQMGHVGGQNASYNESLHTVYLMNEAEADVNVSSFSGPVTLFKDSNDKYFYDFIKESFKKYKTDTLFIDMAFEVAYTCSNATTAANTPFFEKVAPDSDGVYRRTFVKTFMKDVVITPYDFSTGATIQNGLIDYRLSNIVDAQMASTDNTRFAFADNSYSFDFGMYMPYTVWNTYNDGDNDGSKAFFYPYYGAGQAWQFGEQAHCHFQTTSNVHGNRASSFAIDMSLMSWGPSFFENSNLTPPPAGMTSNEGRGCERTFKVKIKQ